MCRKLIVSSHFEDEGSLKMVLQDGSVVDPSISGCGNLGEGLSLQSGGFEGPECGKDLSVEWSKSRSAVFSKFLGLPTEGFEKEMTALLRKMKARKKGPLVCC